MIYVPGLFAPQVRLDASRLEMEDLLEPPVVCGADLPVAALIDRLQDATQEMAVVCDGDRLTGVVTITDALEVIAGEVRDPLDEPRSREV